MKRKFVLKLPKCKCHDTVGGCIGYTSNAAVNLEIKGCPTQIDAIFRAFKAGDRIPAEYRKHAKEVAP